MQPRMTAPRRQDHALPDGLAALWTGGGDERIAVDPVTGRNAYGCPAEVWSGGPTFSSSTASPLLPEGLQAASRLLAGLKASPGERAGQAAGSIRRRLAELCGLDAGTDVVLAPSGTDLHLLAAVFARAAGRGALTVVTPDPAQSGRGVERALRGLRYAQSPPFARAAYQGLIDGAVEMVTIPASPAEAVDEAFEAACSRAARGGGPVLLVLLDVSKTGLVAPAPETAARLKGRFGDQVTVLVDACQFRLSPDAIRAHLERDFLVAVTGSKFLGGPPFSGALMVPPSSAGRLRSAHLAWPAVECSAREDWPEAYSGRALLPAAASLGPALRWAAALDNLQALLAMPANRVAALTSDFAAVLNDRLGRAPASFAPLPPRPSQSPATLFPLVLRRDGRPLSTEAVLAAYLKLRDTAHRRNAGHLWLGQPAPIAAAPGDAPITALRLALGAPQLIAEDADRLMDQADACLWELERIIAEA